MFVCMTKVKIGLPVVLPGQVETLHEEVAPLDVDSLATCVVRPLGCEPHVVFVRQLDQRLSLTVSTNGKGSPGPTVLLHRQVSQQATVLAFANTLPQAATPVSSPPQPQLHPLTRVQQSLY